MFGRDQRNPFSTTIPETPKYPIQTTRLLLKLITGLIHTHEVAHENMKYHKEKMYFPAVKVGQITKLHKKFSGPYIIMEKVHPNNYKVVHGHDMKPLKNMVHVDPLKHFIDREVVPPTEE